MSDVNVVDIDGVMSDTLATMTTEAGKKSMRVTFRLNEEAAVKARAMMEEHGAVNQSKYFRGLLIIDLLLSKKDILGLEIPAWVSRSFPSLFASRSHKSPIRTAEDRPSSRPTGKTKGEPIRGPSTGERKKSNG